MIKGVIFDLDGVITDTAEYHFLGWKKMAEEEGLYFDRKINENLRGVSRLRSLDIILENNSVELTDEKKEELAEKKNRYYRESLDLISEKDYLPGIKALILEMRSRNVKTAIASASKNAKTVVKNLRAEDLFEFIADGYSVTNTKPEPDLFLFAVKSLGLKADECVVVEDARAGVEAANKGGIHSVGIGPEERVGEAELRYADTSEMNADEILTLG